MVTVARKVAQKNYHPGGLMYRTVGRTLAMYKTASGSILDTPYDSLSLPRKIS